MPKIKSQSHVWKRINTRSGVRYQKDGKFTSKEKWKAAKKRQRGQTRKIIATSTIKRRHKWRKLNTELKTIGATTAKKQKFEKGFCYKKTREEFYDQVLRDRKLFRDKLGEASSSAFQLWFQIGDGEKRKRKSDRRLQYTHGLRKFVNIKKAHTFLGLDKWDYEKRTGIVLPKWKQTGKNSVCRFEKKAWLVMSRVQGTRALKPKVLKKYIIQE